MTEYAYSYDRDDFNDDNIEDALEGLANFLHPEELPEIVEIYRGEIDPVIATQFTPNVLEYMGEQAYGEFGEHAECWPNATPEQEKELQEAVDNLVLEWFQKHKIHTTFYRIKNIQTLAVKHDGEGKVVKWWVKETPNEV